MLIWLGTLCSTFLRGWWMFFLRSEFDYEEISMFVYWETNLDSQTYYTFQTNNLHYN